MASKQRSGGSRWETWPKKAIAAFIVLLVSIYMAIFFTGDRTATPKLGIDLQGGTRVTLVPQGEEATQEQLNQARGILENRVNGLGVSGASVVIDGNTLVITVPGEDTAQARALGQTSQLLFRPVATPTNFDQAVFPVVLQEMANRWVENGLADVETLNQKLAETTKRLEEAEKAAATAEQEEAKEGDDKEAAKASEANAAAKKDAKAETPAALSLKVTANPPATADNSIEAAKQRNQALEIYRKDRQSNDPTVQLAASILLTCDPTTPDILQGSDDPAESLVACDADSGQVYVLGPVPLLVGETDMEHGKRLTGEEIDTNRPISGGLNTQTGQMEISFGFKSGDNDQGSATWAQLTQAYLQQQVAITLDSKIISAPVIQSATPVGSMTSITGSFTQQQAQDLANNLRYGALPLSFVGENGEQGGTAITVPASLGVASLKAGLIAGLVGLLLVALFSLYFYRYFGVISLISLAMSALLVYGSLVLLGRLIGYSLDLAGVAGLIIGIGTTADSFVVLYERIKDEIRDGRTFRSAVPHAWDRAKNTIVTGNFVTIIAAVVIYILAVGEVKGFAFTLGLTTMFDLLVTFLFTAPMVILASRKPWTANPAANGLKKVFTLAANTTASAADHNDARQIEGEQ
ncbi:protein translocase subunit SecD [Corynebacterium sp. HS2168-gen11]|uniref:protein translocase subunit SecD n=1 Tax=Corynebacterium sp. HS2168-gen11 TaxID=2974027 RepID=UPI0037BE445A